MRRRDREVTEHSEIMHILDSGKVLHLGLVDQGRPYIVPMNYGYVFEGEKYIGRTAVGAEDSYFVLSQVFCVDDTKRESFLEQTMLYCEKKYHYNRYQLILDTSWKDATDKIGLQGCFRYMPAKRVKKIMFLYQDLQMEVL